MHETPPAFFGSISLNKSAAISVFSALVVVLLLFSGCGGGAMGNNALAANPNAETAQAKQATQPTADPNQNEAANQPTTPTAPTPPPAIPDPPAQPAPPANQKEVANIQNMGGWVWCTAKLNGQPCASGEGNAKSSKTDVQQTPSLSGSSSMFWIGGPTPYSNALWWRELGPDAKPTHFNYDLYFYLEDASAPEALEFDVNQTIDGTRYVFGTECSYRNTGHWQIWNSKGNRWFNTDVPCPPVSSKTWHHLVWQFERVNGQAHFIGVTLDGKYSAVEKYFDPEKFGKEGVSVAVQLDGDSRQTPYKLWLDKVSLITW